MQVFGISVGTILLIIAVAIVVRKWGSQIPLINTI